MNNLYRPIENQYTNSSMTSSDIGNYQPPKGLYPDSVTCISRTARRRRPPSRCVTNSNSSLGVRLIYTRPSSCQFAPSENVTGATGLSPRGAAFPTISRMSLPACSLRSRAGCASTDSPMEPSGGSLPAPSINHEGFNTLLMGCKPVTSSSADSGPQDDEQNANANPSIAHPANRTRSSAPTYRPQR